MRQLIIALYLIALTLGGYAHATPNEQTTPPQQETAATYSKKFYADYAHLEKDMLKLYKKLPKKKWKGIIAIARGGMYPGLFLAHKLDDIRHVETLALASYSKDKKQSEIRILQHFDFTDKNDGEGWLVIDDLVDTGKTIAWVHKHLPKAHYAVIYAKPKGMEFIDTYGTEIPQNTWIEFPWDKF